MNILKWLKVGISLFLLFNQPLIIIEEKQIILNLEMSNLLTKQMINLVNHGVEIEYEIYVSLLAFDQNNNKELFKTKIRRKLYYDYLDNTYYLVENNNMKGHFHNINLLIAEAKRFEQIVFELQTDKYAYYSLFAQMTLIENTIIEDQLKMKTKDLWDGYKPYIEMQFDKSGMEM
jgi:hypothetical protein